VSCFLLPHVPANILFCLTMGTESIELSTTD
jgi:hypothetical protein